MLEQIGQWLWRLMGGHWTEVTFSLLVFIGALLTVKFIAYNYTLPPGPWGLPMFGYLPFIKGHIHLQFNKLAKKYGSMFSIRLGSELTVVISDYRIIRDLFRREELTGRPHTDFMNILDGYGIINSEGALWKNQRKFLHANLRSFGMTFNSGKSMESKIKYETIEFLKKLVEEGEKPVILTSTLATSISNVICSVMMGVRFHYGDLKFERFMEIINEGFKLFAKLTPANYIPILRHLPLIHGVRDKIEQNRAEMARFFQDVINEHKTTYNDNNIRDIVDAYLYEIQKAERENRGNQLFEGKDKIRQLQQTLGDLFSAGMETVKNTLEWSVIFMLHYPEAARAVQNELDKVVGRSRLPSLEDFSCLPITKATILEIFRRSTLVPLGTTHATTRDVMLNGYMLPAGTHVIPLLYTVHMNPELWDEPEVFRPSRFLSDKGEVCEPKFYMPFGVGRRMCLGDVLARMEVFLFFSSLMHTFNLSLPEGAQLPSLEGNIGITMSPTPFEVCLVQREPKILVGCGNEDIKGPLRNIGSH